MISKAFCDGGVVLRNPSLLGGTWACVVSFDSGRDHERSGVVLPEDYQVESITNNFTELLAAIKALELVLAFYGEAESPLRPLTLFTDSQVTQRRLLNPKAKFAGIPPKMRKRVHSLVGELHGRLQVELLDGHPTKLHLLRGTGKRGHPVHHLQARCDELCGIESKNFLRTLGQRNKENG